MATRHPRCVNPDPVIPVARRFPAHVDGSARTSRAIGATANPGPAAVTSVACYRANPYHRRSLQYRHLVRKKG